MIKNPPAIWETWVRSLGWDDPLGVHGISLQCSCLEIPHGQRGLVGCSLWGHKELDRTERLNTAQHTSIKADHSVHHKQLAKEIAKTEGKLIHPFL